MKASDRQQNPQINLHISQKRKADLTHPPDGMQQEFQKHPRDGLAKSPNLNLIKPCYLATDLQEREGLKKPLIPPTAGVLNSGSTDTGGQIIPLEGLQHLSKHVTCAPGLDPDSENQREGKKHHETRKCEPWIFDLIKKLF